MRVIYKYQINFGTPMLELARGAKCIHIGQQYGRVTMWAEVTADEEDIGLERWHLIVLGTGHQLPEDIEYEHLGTAMIDPFVWHVYRVMP